MDRGAQAASTSLTATVSQPIETRVQQIGRELLSLSLAAKASVFQAQWWQQKFLEWTMHNAELRTQLFRFVDVLPALQTRRDVAEHLTEYLLNGSVTVPRPLELALRFHSAESLAARIAAVAARRNVRQIAYRFIAGETMAEALATVQQLRSQRMAFTLDVLGEAVTSDSQADQYAQQYRDLVDGLTAAAALWPAVPQIDHGRDGPLPRVNVSLKLSALDPRFDPIAAGRSCDVVGQRLRPILRAARQRGAFVNVDMEEYAYKNLVLHIFKTILLEEEFRDFSYAGIVLQAYLKDTEHNVYDLIDWARRRGHPVTVRLVKGAYWDMEMVHAAQRGWPSPVFTEKWETDAAFERLTAVLVENHRSIRSAFASHNVRSLANAIALAEHYGLASDEYELQMLYGMGDPLKAALVDRGLRVRVYMPYGPLIPGMAYLIRRLLENTSNESFLRQSFTEHVPIDELLANPAEALGARTARPPARHFDSAECGRAARAPGEPTKQRTDERERIFTNEPLTDFSVAANRATMAAAIRDVRADHCGRTYPLIIGGRPITTSETLDSRDPSRPDFLIGHVARAGVEHAQEAIAVARKTWAMWRNTHATERAGLLRRLADQLRHRRFELAAWIMIETAKPWREADADVAEAIDYCEFYAGEAVRLEQHVRRRNVPGEQNVLVYRPRGVAAIIAPWNFPLAILTGMTVAALVTGNTAVVKPAEQSSVIAAKFFELLLAAGLPDGVANFLPGRGEEVGASLVADPQVALIAFTGSRDVGLRIIETAARVHPGQHVLKKVVAEMGGKNAIIIDTDADLDEAVAGVALSAFGYAGQKCSACSRVIVPANIHDAFVKRLIETTTSLPVGPADDPATVVGPLIDSEARDRVLAYIERGRREARLVCQVDPPDSHGYFVGPVIFDDVPPHAAIAQEEIFGPVLSVITVNSFDEALAVANDTVYALTGGVYSRRPTHIAQARSEFRVGNLYINRPITGALVDRQPFGGLQLSGVGSKAGGPDYLLQFCEPTTISENTMRHGFTPL